MPIGTKQAELVERRILVNKQPFAYYSPIDDDTVVGTYCAISEEAFDIDKIKEIKDGDVIVDIGSNVGLLSACFAKTFPSLRIISFDANPIACLCAKMTRCRNSIVNWDIFHVAIGTEYDNACFSTTEREISASIQNKYCSDQDHPNEYTCDIIPFDEIFYNKLLGVDRVKYLKIDIEGGEYDVLNYVCDKCPGLIDRIDHMHLEVHAYPWAAELKEKVKKFFGDRWING